MPSGSIRRWPLDETRTGSTTSWGSRPAAARPATSRTIAALANMPVFTLQHREVVQDGLHLLAHEAGLQGHDGAHLGCVLCRHRGEGTHPVDPVGREGLQIGLRARTAARVGPGDGERRRWGQVRHRATIGGHRGIVVRWHRTTPEHRLRPT